jgi:hypothetical protein
MSVPDEHFFRAQFYSLRRTPSVLISKVGTTAILVLRYYFRGPEHAGSEHDRACGTLEGLAKVIPKMTQCLPM